MAPFSVSSSPSSRTPPGTEEHTSARILVVEDEGVVALDLATRLTRMGYQVIGQAASSAQALSLAQADPPDVVLMDIVISGERDGIETARLLQQRFDVAVIYITAYGDD